METYRVGSITLLDTKYLCPVDSQGQSAQGDYTCFDVFGAGFQIDWASLDPYLCDEAFRILVLGNKKIARRRRFRRDMWPINDPDDMNEALLYVQMLVDALNRREMAKHTSYDIEAAVENFNASREMMLARI